MADVLPQSIIDQRKNTWECVLKASSTHLLCAIKQSNSEWILLVYMFTLLFPFYLWSPSRGSSHSFMCVCHMWPWVWGEMRKGEKFHSITWQIPGAELQCMAPLDPVCCSSGLCVSKGRYVARKLMFYVTQKQLVLLAYSLSSIASFSSICIYVFKSQNSPWCTFDKLQWHVSHLENSSVHSETEHTSFGSSFLWPWILVCQYWRGSVWPFHFLLLWLRGLERS